jgi:hypothetical protein
MRETLACTLLCDGTKTKSNLIFLEANGFGGGAKSNVGEWGVGQTVLPYSSRRHDGLSRRQLCTEKSIISSLVSGVLSSTVSTYITLGLTPVLS